MRAIPTSFRFLTAATTTVALATVVVAARLPSLTIYPADTRQVLLDVAVLVALAVVAESLAVEFSDRITVTAANLPVLIAMMFLGPAPAMAVAAVAGAWGFWRERSVFIAVFNAANYTVAAFLGSVLFFGVYGSGASESSLSAALLAAGLMAAAAYRSHQSTHGELGCDHPLSPAVGQLLAKRVATVCPLSRNAGRARADDRGSLYHCRPDRRRPALRPPLCQPVHVQAPRPRERRVPPKQKELSDQYLEMNIGLAAAMVVLLDSKDEYTAPAFGGGGDVLPRYGRVARAAGDGYRGSPPRGTASRPRQGRHARCRAGQDLGAHDEDWVYVRQHPEKGAEVLSHLAAYQDVADIVRYHHERLDGSGYPSRRVRRGDPRVEQDPRRRRLVPRDDVRPTLPRGAQFVRSARGAARVRGVTLDGQVCGGSSREVLRDKDLAYRDGSSTDFMVEYERGAHQPAPARPRARRRQAGVKRRKTQRQASQRLERGQRPAIALTTSAARTAGPARPVTPHCAGSRCSCRASQVAPMRVDRDRASRPSRANRARDAPVPGAGELRPPATNPTR